MAIRTCKLIYFSLELRSCRVILNQLYVIPPPFILITGGSRPVMSVVRFCMLFTCIVMCSIH